ncbi:unnamed protein product [Cuscuta epithymum]|uniref:E2F/DP family winged-helix DNA-binding domain-containing protein n=1 Tax=Cuscuta epithymum TaxID=186058 RepID=A0AAV0E870_9ASTE|nr:unnamed protein product [Cuscuta epithymum]CAH9118565.1 unnamed protein product [Cuscuta epithymum]CAH9148821.1 unnamed protein product [Cuscuta epithymum]
MSLSVNSDSQSKNPITLYSRKEKSLGVLCSNFLRLYDRDDVDCIGLDHAADQLGVERRRIYDIVNILESVGLLSRRAKNQYTWKGFTAVPQTLEALKEEGLREKLNVQKIGKVSMENEYQPTVSSSNTQDSKHDFLSRRAKNQYTCKGFTALPQTLVAHKEEGLREKLNGQKIASVSRENDYQLTVSSSNTQDSTRELDNTKEKSAALLTQNFVDALKKEGLRENLNGQKTASVSMENDYQVTVSSSNTQDSTHELVKGENRKEKSLALLTQNFVKLFLCSEMEFISLDNAASALLGNMHDPTAMRTKVRRLYDIANVFASMNLIEKIRHPESGKPAFRWIGQLGNPARSGSSSAANMNGLKRTFGTDITNNVTKRNKVGSSSDVKPCEYGTQYVKHGYMKDENCKLSPERHKQGSKEFEFGPFSPTSVPREVLRSISGGGHIPNWENLASTYRPRYCNKAANDLFGHYVEAWNSWYIAADESKHDQIHPTPL